MSGGSDGPQEQVDGGARLQLMDDDSRRAAQVVRTLIVSVLVVAVALAIAAMIAVGVWLWAVGQTH